MRAYEQYRYHSGAVLEINWVAYLAVVPLLQVFLKGQKVGEIAEVILLEDHKMSD